MPMPLPPRARETPSPAYVVQFHEDERHLAASVAEFAAAGLAHGTPAVILGRPGPRHAVLALLRAMGHDVDGAAADGRLLVRDSREVLATFMDDGRPDPGRFAESVGGLLSSVSCESGGGPARAYGDMADVLWKSGNASGAAEVERLWNELVVEHELWLLRNCGSAPSAGVESAGEPPGGRTAPSDEAHRPSSEDRLRRRVRVLESEIERRARAEAVLRAELAEREQRQSMAEDARLGAERANRAKSEFLARMSHELRTPLNAIAGHVQLMEMGVHGPLTAQQREALSRAQRGQRTLLALVDDLLDMSRVEAGHVDYALEPVSLPPLLDEVTEMLDPLRAERLLEWSVRLDAAPGGVEGGMEATHAWADREKTQQILLNVLTNALKYTPARGRIAVEFGASNARPGMLRVSVSDTGPGIPSTRLESIFEPFVQLGNAPGGTIEGVGLGLAISRSLARGMGGELLAESVEGEGSTFTLLLPAAG